MSKNSKNQTHQSID